MKKSIPETQPDVQSKGQEPQRNSIPVDSGQDSHGNNENAAATPKRLGSLTSKAKSVRTKKSVRWNPELVTETTFVASPEDSPRIFPSTPFSSSPSFSVKDTVDTVRDVLGRWGRKVGEATRKAECLAENTWVHLRTNPSFTEAAVGRIARGTKVLAEGGYENIFLQTFETIPGEQVLKAYACYISTSVGPVMGILYISTAKIAYCSDNPISYYQDDEETEWSYYKVIIPLHQLKAVIPSSNRLNPAEKYIQLTSNDNHEFWFMGFFNYDATMDCLKEVLQTSKSQSAR